MAHSDSYPGLSIIIVGMNVEGFLPPCLASVAGLDYPREKIEVIYVDNASSDRSVECASRAPLPVRIVRNDRNMGFSEGNNIGLRIAGGEYLVLLNADAELHPAWAKEMLRCFRDDPRVGIAGCKIYYGRTTVLQHAGGFYDDLMRTGHYGIYEEDRGQYDEQREVGYVTAAAIMLSRKCLETIGLFDRNYFIYGEETDWAIAATRAGFKVVYVPGAIAYHHEMSYTKGRTKKFYFLLARARYRLLIKYFGLRWFFAAFRRDIVDRRAGLPEAQWPIRIVVKAFLWNIVRLPQTLICRGRVFK